ncbi:MAG: HEAT repeat domain-containing protein, partial [Planctomycetes bacterium]|nr:HEAT repeat domain-containing protein [Planctomycetota bacterium]
MKKGLLFLLLALTACGMTGVGGSGEESRAAAKRGLPFQVPPGFVAELVAEPPLVEYPMFACFDDRGRLYVVDSAGVNWLPEQLSKDPPHRIRLLEDRDGDGRFDQSKVFADRLTYPQGVLWHRGAVYTSSPPSLWRLEDTRGTGVADKREELVTGFTFTKWADDLHGPFLGPDGRIYWTSGRYPHEVHRPGGEVGCRGDGPLILRARPDGSEAEAFCSAIGNPVEVAFSAEGEPFAAGTFALRGSERDAVFHGVFGGVCPIKDKDIDSLRGIKHTGEPLPMMVHFGVVAPSGLMRYRSGAFGAEYRDNLFTALFGQRAVQRLILERDGATFRARVENFLTATTPDFHPTDVLEDADGSLLVVDTGNWYNLCPSSQVGKVPVPGGIYRIRRQGMASVADPRGLALPWQGLPAQELTRLLDDPRFAVRDRAIEQLAGQGSKALTVLQEFLRTSPSAPARRRAVWALTRMEGPDARAGVRTALADKEMTVRLAAVNAVGLHRDAAALARLTELLATDVPPVRREAATALGRLRRPEAVPALLAGLRAGGDPYVEHALIYALIEIADRQAAGKGLQDPSPAVRRGALIALDQMEAGQLTREQVTPLLNTEDPALRQTALSIITRRPGWAGELTGLVRQWLDQGDLDPSRSESLRGALLAFCRDPEIQKLVAQALARDRTPPALRLLLLETMARAPLEKLPPEWVAAVGRSLHHQDERVVRQGIATLHAAGIAGFDPDLLSLTRDTKQPTDLRVAALAAAAPRLTAVEPALFEFLLQQLKEDQPPLTRLTAAEALGNLRLSAPQLTALTQEVAAAGPLEMPHLLAAYERSQNAEVGARLVAALGSA